MDLVAARPMPKAERRTVADVMSHAVLTCRPDAPLASAIRAMVERRTRSVLVVDHGRAVGILTAGDLVRTFPSPDSADTAASVATVMSTPIAATAPSATLPEAIDAMLSREIHRLVVVDPEADDVPLGIVSTSDVIAEMADARSVWQREPAAD